MRIYGIHDGGGCGYYRVILPLAELGRHDGWDVELVIGSDVRSADAQDHDLVVAQRMDKHAALPLWRRMRAHSRLVYEIDDDVFSVEMTNWAAYSIYKRQDVLDTVSHAAEVADLVTVTVEPLAEIMRQFNPNVAVINNHIPGWVTEHERPRRDRPVIGWAGGASHAKDIAEIAPHLRRFLGRFPGWDCHLIGTDYRPTVRHPRTRFTPWVPIVSDVRAYFGVFDFDIGVAPLAPGGMFAESKSHIKALEYAALGIPVVASDRAPYRDFILHGVTGFLVRRDHEWLKYLSELAADEELRASMGAKAREVARGWVIGNGWQQWADAYRRLVA